LKLVGPCRSKRVHGPKGDRGSLRKMRAAEALAAGRDIVAA
jgi:hypothetical protein